MSAVTEIVYRKMKKENKMLRSFIVEFAVRAQVRLPETHEQMSWWNEQFSIKFSDFAERLDEICKTSKR